MASVSFSDVKKSFGTTPVLHGVSIDIQDGEFMVLVGPSGCGKSTLLRMLAGLEEISAGEIAIDARVVNDVDSKDRDVAMVFQSYALYPHMTVAENIGYPLRIRGLGKADQRAGAARVAESLEISHLLDRRPRHLSGGQRQRVALARAIVREPSVFLMDEPLSNLDAKLRTSMRGEIKRLQKRLGTTTLYVTHDQAEAMTMADLVAVMREGELQQLAPPDEVYDRPANRFVAAFVGNPPMNVVEGAADRDGGSFVIGDQRLALGAELGAACAAAGATALGIRPEDIEIVPHGTPAALAGEIYVVEPMGNETLVDVRIGEQRVMARAAREFAAPIGSPIGVRVALKSACFFGPEGTTALHRSDRASQRREMSV
jgi:multiple sugar transport system ATP-binding protein